jgi:hypothetical protein
MAAEKSKERAMGVIPWLSCFSRLWESPRIRDIGTAWIIKPPDGGKTFLQVHPINDQAKECEQWNR